MSIIKKMKILLLLGFCFSLSNGNTNILTRYLNSYAHCQGKPFSVDVDTVINLKADAQPGTETQSSLAHCQMVFRSSEEDGQLCVIQDGELNTLGDPNAELIVQDGYGDDEFNIFILKYAPSKWQRREYCTRSPFIKVTLRRINNNMPIAISKLKIDLKIVNIESKFRKIYMQELYCSGEYDLNNSLVRVFNRAHTVEAESLDSVCGVILKKKSNGEARICLVYTPSHRLRPETEWLFVVSNKSYSLQDENIMYRLSWDDSRINTRHTWCASNQTSQVMVILKRNNSTPFSEPPEALGFYFADFTGPEADLLQLVEENDPSSNYDLDYILIAAAAIVCLAIITTVLVVIMFKKQMFSKICHSDYVPAHNPVSKC